ncbi:hypothetical protein XACJK4_840001 [Xanthomonas citri pv. citri]|nr:hypothetical protein XAC3615_4150001 [Xanthomonas citri pv. citri]CEI21120.1 hypothetical protein XACLG98_890002 [Xanthomonas citri pv. citri]CEL36910.1 hypothetical protein XAC4311_660001 [Xanthomonas citri pv. citri]CEL41816.1 hypothetical protein XACJK4_840001 [Xanthomonas citri pv. citri]CEL44015.1 hypothetical protein XAC439_3660001 [Xanthomonas citri pv. citri]
MPRPAWARGVGLGDWLMGLGAGQLRACPRRAEIPPAAAGATVGAFVAGYHPSATAVAH